MSQQTEGMSRREYFEITCIILKEILNPQMLRAALDVAAAKLNIPDAPSVIANLLGTEATAAIVTTERQGRGKDATDNKKEDSRKGRLKPYNVYMSWISDFAAHYGRHPSIVAVKTAKPALKLGLAFASEYYKTIPADKKEAMMRIFLDFANDHRGDGTPGSVLEAFRKFEGQQPDRDIGALLGLQAKPEFKTDPAQMKLESAEARRHQVENGQAPLATPGTAGKAGISNAGANGTNGTGNDMEVDGQEDEEPESEEQQPAAPTPATKSEPLKLPASKEKDKKEKKKDKEGKDKEGKKDKKRKAEGEGAEAEAGGSDHKKKRKTEDGEKEGKKEKKEKKKDKEGKTPKSDKKSEKKSEKKDKKEKKRDRGE